MYCSSSRIKRGRNSSSMMNFRTSSPMVEFIHETQNRRLNLKKPRLDYTMNYRQILNFSSSSLRCNQNRVAPEINELIENKYYSAWRRRRIMSSPEINQLIETKYYSAWRRRRRIMSSSTDVKKSNPSVIPKHHSQHEFVKKEVRRSCSDYDDDGRHDQYCGATALTVELNKPVWSPAQSDITEQQSSKMGSGSDGGEKGGGSDVSDSKSVRADILTKRFSRIIVKAKPLQEKVDRSDGLKLDDSVKMQVDKQILMEKKKLKEAQIAAEAESKRELQKKREAARKALEELERTVDVDDNMKTMKDFAMLLGYPQKSKLCSMCL